MNGKGISAGGGQTIPLPFIPLPMVFPARIRLRLGRAVLLGGKFALPVIFRCFTFPSSGKTKPETNM